MLHLGYFWKEHKLLLFVFIFLVIIFSVWGILHATLSYCRENVPGRSGFGRSPVLDQAAVDQSYTLIAPFAIKHFFEDPGMVYLVDLYGKPVHTWKTKYQTMYAALKKNGHLMVAMIRPADLLKDPGGGGTGVLQELDWHGAVLWEYKNDLLHHDFEILPSGNIATLMWEKTSEDKKKRIIGGKENSKGPDMWEDAIVEIDRSGKEIWRWTLSEHLELGKYPLDPVVPRSDWSHGNSVRYYETNPISNKPIYLISLRHLSRVLMIDRESGKIIWESPEKMLAYQHDATLLPSGNILAFDNGTYRAEQPTFPWSRVAEIDPHTNRIVWELNGGGTPLEKVRMDASIMSGTQRLKNGNTFITLNAVTGHLVEVDANKRLIWEMINPYLSAQSGPFGNNSIFKANRYSPDEIDWPEKIAPPLPQLPELCRGII